MSTSSSTCVSRIVDASPTAVYRAFVYAQAVAAWLPPGAMTGIVHAFDPREGGAFSMSLVYPAGEPLARGKSAERTDTFHGRFVQLTPGEKVVWAVRFESPDPAFTGEMIVSTTLAPLAEGMRTKVTILCENIPPGIRLEDNEAGCRSTLEKLAAYLTESL